MERVHLHTVQQLQFELADARERSGSYADESHLSQSNTKDESNFIQNNGNQLDVNGTAASIASNGELSNGNADNAQSFASTGNAHQVSSISLWLFFPINLGPFGIGVVVAFQRAFRLEMHERMFFHFLKFIFDFSISKRSKNIKK
jgi:hypothetical protein